MTTKKNYTEAAEWAERDMELPARSRTALHCTALHCAAAMRPAVAQTYSFGLWAGRH